MKKSNPNRLARWIGSLALMVCAVAHAQDNRPYKLIVSTPAGAYLDVVARAMEPELTKALGAPVVIESMAGANGMIATSFVARAPADGRTILLINGAISQNEATQSKRPYEIGQLKSLTVVGQSPIVFAIQKSTNVSTLNAYLDLVRADPKKYAYGTWGAGSSGHVLGEILNGVAKTRMTHVPYKGAAPAYADLVAGHITSSFGGPGDLGRLLPTGAFTILAITTEERMAQHPTIPTFKELGYPEMSINGMTTFMVPAATPPAVIDRLGKALQAVGRLPEVNQKMLELGIVPMWLNAAASDRYIHEDAEKWKKAVRDYAIKLD
jgi:tripartite-type tricarboxylate transporter receptor subunit TctC